MTAVNVVGRDCRASDRWRARAEGDPIYKLALRITDVPARGMRLFRLTSGAHGDRCAPTGDLRILYNHNYRQVVSDVEFFPTLVIIVVAVATTSSRASRFINNEFVSYFEFRF